MLNFANPKRENEFFATEIRDSLDQLISQGEFILHDGVSDFESKFAKYIGQNYSVGVGSGTDAISLALASLDIGPGDEVIVPSFTASATAMAVSALGALPIFADINSKDYYLSLTSVRALLSRFKNVKALIYVHLFGGTGKDFLDIVEFCRQNSIHLIEDVAQATGAKFKGRFLGNFGEMSCFSFYPTKNLSAIGDGGAVVTNSSLLKGHLLRKRQYGWDENRECIERGYLSRLDEFQARILSRKLSHLDNLNGKRREIASRYDEVLNTFGMGRLGLHPHIDHANHLYVLEVNDRQQSIEFAYDLKIRLGVHYPKPLHLHEYFLRSGSMANCPNSEIAASSVVTLPLFPHLYEAEVQIVVNFLEKMLKIGLVSERLSL